MLQVAVNRLFRVHATDYLHGRPVVGRDRVGDLTTKAIFARHHHKGTLGILAGDDAAELASLEALVEQVGEVAQAVQTHRPKPGGHALAVLRKRRIFVDESVAIIVDSVDWVFVELAVPIVVKERVQSVLIESAIAIIVELRIRSVLVDEPIEIEIEKFQRVFVDESVAIVVPSVNWIFVELTVSVIVHLLVDMILIDQRVAVVVNQFDGVFVDESVAIVVGDQLNGPTATQVEATGDRAQNPGMHLVADPPPLDFGIAITEYNCDADYRYQQPDHRTPPRKTVSP